MPGPRSLVDWPWVTVELECPLCGRAGRYRLARLAERYGAAAKMGPLLNELAAGCGLPMFFEHTRQYEARCGARFRIPPGGPLPVGVPAREVAPAERPVTPRRRVPEGRLPTVADVEVSGARGILVVCQASRPGGWRCHHTGRLRVEDMKLAPDMPFAHIKGRRLLRCSRCGSRDVSVMPEWPDPRAEDARRMSGGTEPTREVNGTMVGRQEQGAEAAVNAIVTEAPDP